MKVYLAARYSQKDEMKEYAKQLRSIGVNVTSRWLEEPHAPNSQLSDVKEELLCEYAKMDMMDVNNADVLVFFSQEPTEPSFRGGRHVEFGMALAFGMPIVVVGPKENIFHNMAGVKHLANWGEVISFFASGEVNFL